MWCVPGIPTRHGPVSKLRLLTVFSAHAAFPVPAPPLGLPSIREVAWVHHHFLHWTNVRGLSVEQRRATTSAPLLVFSDLRIVFQQTTNLTRKACLLSHVRATITTPGLINAVAQNNLLFGQGHCAVKPSPFHPNAEAATVLVHSFAGIEGLTNTWQHRTPPLSSSTPSRNLEKNSDKFDATVSPAQVASAFAHDGGTHTGNASCGK